MVIALVVVFILFAFLTDGRLVYAQNLSNLMLQNGYVLVMACGMLLCILTGGNIDLSIGSVICMVGGLAAVMISDMSMNPILAIVLCLAVGLLVGVWQGYWIGYVRIPPFITTLGGMVIFRGLGRLVLDNQTVAIQDSTFLRGHLPRRLRLQHRDGLRAPLQKRAPQDRRGDLPASRPLGQPL